MKTASPGPVALALLVVIVALTIIAEQPFMTAVLLPILTGLFVVYAGQSWKAGERDDLGDDESRGLVDRISAGLWARVRRVRKDLGGSLGGSPPEYKILLTTTLCLFVIGSVMVYSASSRRPGLFVDEGAAIADFLHFVVCGAVGVVVMLALARGGLRLARRFTGALLILSFALVIGTRLPLLGVDVNGARRWIEVAGLQFQPAELMKIAFVLYGAQLIAKRPQRLDSLEELAQPLLYVTGAGCLLVTTQPDLGSAMVIGLAVAALLVGAGLRARTFAAVIGSVLVPVGFYVLAQPYARERLTSFFDPWAHASSTGFQLVQAQIAIGSGGLFGRGLGESIEKAYYLPQANTGFVVAVIGEELGFIGIAALLFLYGLLAYAGYRTARRSDELYEALVATGLTTVIVAQALLNLFSVLDLAPELGLPLPFVSYGSSNLLVMFVATGLLMSIARGRESSASREGRVSRAAWARRLRAVVRVRVSMLSAFAGMLLALAGARSFYLGVVSGPDLRRAAAEQQLVDEPVPAPRGAIADRHGLELVGSEAAADVSADPELLPELEPATADIARQLDEPVSKIRRKLAERTGFVYLARSVSVGRARAIVGLGVPGVAVTPTTRPTYPRGSLAGQVLGIVGAEGTGMAGLEYGWNGVLRGRSGERRVISNAAGQPLVTQDTKRMIPGADLQVTLDSYVQSEIEYFLAGAGAECHCSGVAAMVMDAATGEVLALANWPRVPLNDLASLSAGELDVDLDDRILDYDFVPGAALDPFSVAGALQAGVVRPAQQFVVSPRTVGGAVSEDRIDGHLTTSQIVAGASNAGTLLIATEFGLSRIASWLHRFGFGAPTGIDLPGESVGRVPGVAEYGRASLNELPIGFDMTVTPIQLATAYAAIADGGELPTPHVVARIAGKAVLAKPARRVLSPATADALRGMLAQGVGVQSPAPGEPGTHTGIFVGYAPSEQSQIVTVTLVAGQRGAANAERLAASLYHQTMAFVLPYLGTR
jgi:cell division protein FtsW